MVNMNWNNTPIQHGHELFDVEYGVDFGRSEGFINYGTSGDGWQSLRTTEFADSIVACRSDPTCPTFDFNALSVEKCLVKRDGLFGQTEAKAIFLLKDGRYAFVTSYESVHSRSNRAGVSRDLAGLVLFSLPEYDRATIGWDALGI